MSSFTSFLPPHLTRNHLQIIRDCLYWTHLYFNCNKALNTYRPLVWVMLLLRRIWKPSFGHQCSHFLTCSLIPVTGQHWCKIITISLFGEPNHSASFMVAMAEMKHHDQKQLGDKGFISAYSCGILSEEVRAGAQSKELEPWRKEVRVYNPGQSRSDTAPSGLRPHMAIISQDHLQRLVYLACLVCHFPNWCFPFPDESSLCQVDRKPKQHHRRSKGGWEGTTGPEGGDSGGGLSLEVKTEKYHY